MSTGRKTNAQPFRGLRYNLERIADPSTVVTPPYDVISPDQLPRYYEKSPYSFIRLEFGEEHAGDTEDDNRYTRAARTLDEWMRQGILVRETEPSLYVLEQRFVLDSSRLSRFDLICAFRLAEFETGRVRPHEETASKASEDRLRLIRACRANLSPVMGLVSTAGGELFRLLRDSATTEPVMTTEDERGVEHRLWVVSNQESIDGISTLLDDRPVYIADGHHRYQTALKYRNERRSAASGDDTDQPFDFVMMSIMDSNDPGVVVSPTHRVVRDIELDRLASLEASLQPYFETIEVLPRSPDLDRTAGDWLLALNEGRPGEVRLGLYRRGEAVLRLLRLRRDADLTSFMAEDELRIWQGSDVVLAQRVVIERALGLDTPDKLSEHVSYTREAVDAIAAVDSGDCELAILLSAIDVSTTVQTADAGKRLPQKSTYFYPKTPAGLVINPLW